MLILSLCVVLLGIACVTLLQNTVGSVMSSKINTDPKWIGVTLKIIVSIIITALIIVGTLCTAFVLVAVNTKVK